MKTTTDLTDALNGVPFTWGEFIQVHEIGRYNFIECKRHFDGSISYHIYVDGVSQGCSSDNLEHAVLMAFDLGANGLNSQMGFAAYRCIFGKVGDE